MRVVGIDLGMKKVAVATWEDGVLLDTQAYVSNAPTMPQIWDALCSFTDDYCYQMKADTIFIEDIIIGNNRKYSIGLAKTYGAVCSALVWCPVIPVNVSTWKKEVLGNGRATKDEVRDYLYSADSAYSVLCGDDQDRFDAACIGFYGHIIATRARSLQLADSG